VVPPGKFVYSPVVIDVHARGQLVILDAIILQPESRGIARFSLRADNRQYIVAKLALIEE
jgi:hypothetical protein